MTCTIQGWTSSWISLHSAPVLVTPTCGSGHSKHGKRCCWLPLPFLLLIHPILERGDPFVQDVSCSNLGIMYSKRRARQELRALSATRGNKTTMSINKDDARGKRPQASISSNPPFPSSSVSSLSDFSFPLVSTRSFCLCCQDAFRDPYHPDLVGCCLHRGHPFSRASWLFLHLSSRCFSYRHEVWSDYIELHGSLGCAIACRGLYRPIRQCQHADP